MPGIYDSNPARCGLATTKLSDSNPARFGLASYTVGSINFTCAQNFSLPRDSLYASLPVDGMIWYCFITT